MLLNYAARSRRTVFILSLVIATIQFDAGRAAAQVRPELAWIPQNSVGFLHVRVGDLWNGEVGAALRKQFSRDSEDLRRELEILLGASPEGVDSVTFVGKSVEAIDGFFTRKAPYKKDFDFKDKKGDFKDAKDFDFKDAIKKDDGFKDKKDFDIKDRDRRDFGNKDKKDFDFKDKDKDFDFKQKDFDFKDRRFGQGGLDWRSEGPEYMQQAGMRIVTTAKPYNRDRVKELILGRGESVTWAPKNGKVFWVSPRSYPFALHFVNDHTYVVASPPAYLLKLLDEPLTRKFEGPLAPALEWAAAKRTVVFALNAGEQSAKDLRNQLLKRWSQPWQSSPTWAFLPLVDMQSAMFAFDVAKDSKAEGRVAFANEKLAILAEDSVQDTLTLLRLNTIARSLHMLRMDISTSDDPAAKLLVASIFEQVDKSMRATTIKRQNAVIHLEANAKIDVPALKAKAAADAESLEKDEAAQRNRRSRVSANNLKFIMLAMHGFHDAMKFMPPPAVCDLNTGKPLLSWRVLLLPYLDEEALFAEFKLDEPWDSPHNIKLLPRMPKYYAPVGIKTKEPHTTFYQVLTGPDAGFPLILNKNNKYGARSLSLLGVTDGTSNTMGVVEAFEPVPWTKPADLVYDAKKPLPRMGGAQFDIGFHAAFMDGFVRFLSNRLDEATLRAVITSKGNEVVDLDKLDR